MTDDLEIGTKLWLRGESTPKEVREILQRLLSKLMSGESRRPVGEKLLSRALKTVDEAEYAQVVSEAVEVAKHAQAEREAESHRARQALARFLDPEAVETPIAELPAMPTWAFVHGLVVDYWEAEYPDPTRAVEMAQEIVRLALELDAERYGEARVEDLRAQAFAKLGNTLRIQNQFRRAECTFGPAREHLRRGTGDPLVKARIDYAEATLCGGQERFDQSFHLLDKVEATARRLRDDHLLGKALISRAHFHTNSGQTEEALCELQMGLRHIDLTQEPRLVMIAWHNLILTLTYEDRYREAAERLPYLRSLHARFGKKLDRLRLQWVEGKIDLARGEQSRAEAALEKVRDRFIEADLGFDAALVSLDLAHVYAQQGRSEDMRRLAREMIPIFESRDMHREAIAALLVFEKASAMDQVSVHLVEDLTSFLRRARGNPKLTFHRTA